MSKFKEGKKRSIVASVTYLLLSASKIILGLLFSSLVVYADSIHSITDFLTGIVVFVGLSLAERPVSEEFPFGMYKAENLASLLVAIVMAYAGVDIIRSSLFSGFSTIRYPLMLISLEATSCIVTYWLSRYLSKTPGVKLYSVKAEGLHAYQDTLISLGVIMGVLGEWFNYQYLGNAVAVGVAAYILYQSYLIGRDSLLILLDISDKGAVEDIKKVVYTISEVVGVHEIKVRRTGPFLVASMHLEVPPSLSVKEADELADVVEKKLKESIDSLVYVSIHIE
ncbi:MAG: cation diffusion facilitator family transporter, partial [Caldisphaeraceae archaeon]|nr:cation diffusion facilitator family transporter [Caldisphaeraceae archaeon]